MAISSPNFGDISIASLKKAAYFPTSPEARKVGAAPDQIGTTTTSPGTTGGNASAKLENPTGSKSSSSSDFNDIKMGANSLYNKTKFANVRLDNADAKYKDSMAGSSDDYLKKLSGLGARYQEQLAGLGKQAANQASSARQVYDNTILPTATNMLDADTKEASNAMTLEEAGDPNNSVMTAVRNMYGDYANGVGRQGQQSSAVLGALGAQNAAMAFGASGAPLSVGQQQALYASSQNQAGQAYARTQQQMESLREQGINKGFDESDAQYQRGERAKGRAKDALSQLSDEQSRNIMEQSGLRNEQGRVDADSLGVGQNLNAERQAAAQRDAGLGQSNVYNMQNRNISAENQKFGIDAGLANAQIAQSNAQNAGQAQLFSGLGTLAGGVLGAYYGGPAGATAGAGVGGAVGKGIGGAANPQQASYQPNPYGGANPYGSGGGGYSPYQPYAARAYG